MLFSLCVSGLLYGFFAGLIAFFMSPLQYIKIARQETSLTYSQITRDAFATGNPLLIFFRGVIPYTGMNFLSNMSFGISDFISGQFLLLEYGIANGVILRSLLGGFIETGLTIYPEMKEIIKNKGELAKTKGKLLEIVFPIILRNSLAWVGATISYEVAFRFEINQIQVVLLSFILGIVFGIISIPFDVIATQNCGSGENLNTIERAFKIFNQSKIMLLSGSLIRITQIAIFTAVTVLTMFFIRYLGI